MTTPIWEAGHLYLPGDLVQPIQAAVAVSTEITNPGFETGDDTDWTLGSAAAVSADLPYAGTYSLKFTGTAGVDETIHDEVAVTPGCSITASCMYFQGGASAGHNGGNVFLRWFDAGMSPLSTSPGNVVNSASYGTWKVSTVTATAPAGAEFVAIGISVNRDNWNVSFADNFSWNYFTPPTPAGLIYKAVQPDPGTSDNVEPVWPTTLGVQVIDNTVTWEAVTASRVVWEAVPILKSGDTEPTWPTEPGGFVTDGTISWECISRRVEDPKCPNSRYVKIMASKVFAGDGDITKFCATANPLDWSTENDAGYLPTGLQTGSSHSVRVLAEYRGNLAIFDAGWFQNWQVDPDPTAMAFLDKKPIGSVWHHAAVPVGDELLFLSQLGVRSVGVAIGADNLKSGDAGTAIDPLIRDALADAIANALEPFGTYYPGGGQYWLAFRPAHPIIAAISGPLPDTCDDAEYSQDLGVGGGIGPYENAQVLTGTAPDGMTLTVDGSTLTIAFTDAEAGDYNFWITVDDADGNASAPFHVEFTVTTFEINAFLPDGSATEAYSETVALTGGLAPYGTPTITAGALPTGGTVDVDGETLVVAWPDGVDSDTYDFTISVEDSRGCVAEQSYEVDVMAGAISFNLAYKVDTGGGAGARYTTIAVGSVDGTGAITVQASREYGPDVYAGSDAIAAKVYGNVLFTNMYSDQSGVTNKGGIYALSYDGTTTLVEEASWQLAALYGVYLSFDILPDGRIAVLVEDGDALVSGLYVLNYAAGVFTVVDFLAVGAYTTFGGNAKVLVHNGTIIVHSDKSGDTLRAYSFIADNLTYVSSSGALLTTNGKPYQLYSDGTYIWVNTAQVFDFNGSIWTEVANATVTPSQRNAMGVSDSRFNILSGGGIKKYTISGAALNLDSTTTGTLSTYGYSMWADGDYLFMGLPNGFSASESGLWKYNGTDYTRQGPLHFAAVAHETGGAYCSGFNTLPVALT